MDRMFLGQPGTGVIISSIARASHESSDTKSFSSLLTTAGMEMRDDKYFLCKLAVFEMEWVVICGAWQVFRARNAKIWAF